MFVESISFIVKSPTQQTLWSSLRTYVVDNQHQLGVMHAYQTPNGHEKQSTGCIETECMPHWRGNIQVVASCVDEVLAVHAWKTSQKKNWTWLPVI